jgi:hypothetical protein
MNCGQGNVTAVYQAGFANHSFFNIRISQFYRLQCKFNSLKFIC